MRKEVAIDRSEDERSSELERILSQFVLPMPLTCGTNPRLLVESEKELPHRSLAKPRCPIGQALLVDEERERDPGVAAERCRVVAASKADRGDARPRTLDLVLMVAQPGDMLAAEYSAVVAKERDDRGAGLPEGTQPNLGSGHVREFDGCQRRCDGGRHARSLPRKLGHTAVRRSY